MCRILLIILVSIGLLTSSLTSTATAATLDAVSLTTPILSAPAVTTISVPAAQPWTNTGLDLNQGDQVTITASGRIRIAGSDPGKYPDGRTFDYETPGTECLGPNWVTENAACWSLIGRIGNATPFPVGFGTSFSVTTPGRLYLGVNDDYFPDNSGSWTAKVEITEAPANESPVCTQAEPSRALLWPPNHKFVTVNILGITDPEDDPITIEITSVKQDEPVDDTGDGKFAPDAKIGASSAEVRAERLGNGNGRVYHIDFQAEDGQGGSCSGEVLVGVPHDRKDNPVDDGARYDSTVTP